MHVIEERMYRRCVTFCYIAEAFEKSIVAAFGGSPGFDQRIGRTLYSRQDDNAMIGGACIADYFYNLLNVFGIGDR